MEFEFILKLAYLVFQEELAHFELFQLLFSNRIRNKHQCEAYLDANRHGTPKNQSI